MPPTSISPPRTPGDCTHTSASRSTRSTAQLQPTGGDRNELLSTLAAIAAHSPANIAYRSLTRVLSPGHRVSDVGLWEAAATLAAGLRSLFNRLDSTLLLDKLYGTAEPYWRTCASLLRGRKPAGRAGRVPASPAERGIDRRHGRQSTS